MTLELRHLRYFVAVAEARHFTRAAQQLGIAQPPLSQQIRALEARLETPLFLRRTRGMELTPAGAALLEEARALLRQAEQVEARVRGVARGEVGQLRLGMINSAPFHPLIPGVIREFRRRHPGVALSLEEGTTPLLANAVLERRMDAAFVRPLLVPIEGLSEIPLMSEALVVALPADHRLSRRPSLPLLALSLEPFVLFPRAVGAGLHEEILRACHAAGFMPRVIQETSQVTSIVNLVAAGIGVSIVPASMQQAQIDGVAYRPIRGSAPRARLSLLYRAGEEEAPQLKNLRAAAAA